MRSRLLLLLGGMGLLLALGCTPSGSNTPGRDSIQNQDVGKSQDIEKGHDVEKGEDPGKGQDIEKDQSVNRNSGQKDLPIDTTARCGDGKCEGNENCSTCPDDCGCANGQVCFNGSCCTPKTCQDLGWTCGTGDDGYGGPIPMVVWAEIMTTLN